MQHLLVNLVLIRGVDREVMAILVNQRLAAEVKAMQPSLTYSPALGWWSQYQRQELPLPVLMITFDLNNTKKRAKYDSY